MKESLSQKILKYIRHPSLIGGTFVYTDFFYWVPDKLYLKILYRLSGGLDIETSQAFNG